MTNRRRERPSVAKKRRESRNTRSIYGVVVTIFLVATMLFVIADGSNPPVDDDLCLADTPPPQTWAIVIDVSDPINHVQRRSIHNIVNDLKRETDKYALFAVFKLSSDPESLLEPVLSLCNPGDGSDMNSIYQNSKLAKKRWEKDFVVAFDSTLKSLLDREGGDNSSPIMEGIQAVKVSLQNRHSPQNNLVLFSDMLQHTDVYSHYRSPSASYDQASKSVSFASARTDLSGWSIQAHVFRRDGLNSSRAFASFWDQYFLEMNGLLTIWDKLDG
jgi:hypothetical protein